MGERKTEWVPALGLVVVLYISLLATGSIRLGTLRIRCVARTGPETKVSAHPVECLSQAIVKRT